MRGEIQPITKEQPSMTDQPVLYKIITPRSFRLHMNPSEQALTHIQEFIQEKRAWL